MKVEIKPLPRTSFHGKDGRDSFVQPKTIEALYDSRTGRYATGMDEEETKKYSDMLKLDLSSDFNPATPHPYWSTQSARVKLENHTMILDTDNPMDFIKWRLLRASKFVARSYKAWEEGEYPYATHVIFDEAEEVAVKATKVQKRNKCIAAAAKMSADEKANIVQILSSKTVRGRTNDFIDVEVDNLINEKPDEFLKYITMDKKDVHTRAAVLEAIHRNILTKEGASVYYMGDKLANDVDEAVTYFMDPQNQKLKVSIMEKLN